MARWKDYTRKQTPSEADEVMLLDTDGKANKRTTLKELARTIGNTGGFPDVDDTLTKPGMAADAKTVGDQIKQIAQQMEDLQYVPIEILSFSNNVGIAELGSVRTQGLHFITAFIMVWPVFLQNWTVLLFEVYPDLCRRIGQKYSL